VVVSIDKPVYSQKYIVDDRFSLSEGFKTFLRTQKINWGFGALSEAVYFRTYSRLKEDGSQERWADTVIRVVEGVMSIRKDWYRNTLGKHWDEAKAQNTAKTLAQYIFDMKILPPGRGLWAMGTDYVFERGSHSLQNCGSIAVNESLSRAAEWTADSLMMGVGVGVEVYSASLPLFKQPNSDNPVHVVVDDSREGWVNSIKTLIESYENGSSAIEFNYNNIRKAGTKLSGFGGTSAGSAPLEKLHDRLYKYLDSYVSGKTSQTRLIADVMNAIGACVVSGNIRRSALILVGASDDEEFVNLKNYGLYPEREEIGWMSNNSLALTDREDFSTIPDIAHRIRDNGEPGIINFLNIRKYGRLGERMSDDATGINPCAEIPLESAETCNLVEVFPTRCSDNSEIWDAMKYATFYSSTVSLLRSHNWRTNDVVAKNRRIGVSVSGIADWIDATSVSNVFDVLNKGYEFVVRPTNAKLAEEAGIAKSVRVTTVKPSGSISLLAGVSAGMHYPVDNYVIRRMRIAQNSPISEILSDTGIPHEKDHYSDNTEVFEFPLRYGNGKTRSVKRVSIYEQAATAAMLQKVWADNAVSNTLTAQPNELDQIESVIAFFAPQVKSLSILPDRTDAYTQMPLESITESEYNHKMSTLNEIDWSRLTGTDGEDTSFCANDVCEV